MTISATLGAVGTCACSHSSTAHAVSGRSSCVFCSCVGFTPPAAPREQEGQLTKYAGLAFEALAHQPAFQDVSNEALAAFVAQGHGRILRAGELLASEGDCSASVYVVLEGEVAVDHALRKQRHQELAAAGDLAGDLTALTGERESGSIYAPAEATVVELDAEKLRPAFRRYPDLLKAVVETLARFMPDNQERIRLTFQLLG